MWCFAGPLPEPDVRTIEQMRGVLANPECSDSGPLYYMYRDLAVTAGDRTWLARHALRYDITVIPSRSVCGERVKTKGHYHPCNPEGTGYPEIYEVLRGSAHYLIQDKAGMQALVIEAAAGDLVIIPPSYGHVTINPGAVELVMANIVSTRFLSIYEEYERLHGAAYYEMDDGSYVKNPHYPSVPPLTRTTASRVRNSIALPDIPLYGMIGSDRLDFLNYPQDYPDLFRAFLAG